MDDYSEYSYDDPDDPYTDRPRHVSGLPLGTSGITGRVPHNLRETLRRIYNAFWIKEFTCEDIKNADGFKRLNFRGKSKAVIPRSQDDNFYRSKKLEFKCTHLRALHNYGVITFIMKKVKGSRKPVRVWKLTSEAVQYFATH